MYISPARVIKRSYGIICGGFCGIIGIPSGLD
jgi:hypothetical protein